MAERTTQGGDDLGDRMKAYEAVESARMLDRSLPIYARIDGRAFSTFTRDLQRPFDQRLHAAMIATTAHLVTATQAKIAYTQSDEINLVWLYETNSEPLFANKVHKLTSVLASLAAAVFQSRLPHEFGPDATRLISMFPHFDARVMQLPSRDEAANAILWRTLDARKNAVSMAARAALPAKALDGKDQAAMLAMMTSAGIAFANYPISFRRGTFLQRVTQLRQLLPDEVARIPAVHRPSPGAGFMRSTVEVIDMPDFIYVANRAEVIFDGQKPQPKAMSI